MTIRSIKELRLKTAREQLKTARERLEYTKKYIKLIDKRIEMNKRHLNIVNGMIKDVDISFIFLIVLFSSLILGGTFLIILKIHDWFNLTL